MFLMTTKDHLSPIISIAEVMGQLHLNSVLMQLKSNQKINPTRKTCRIKVFC